MLCPLSRAHRLLEVAPGVWQCPKCGFGPRPEGNFSFWSLAFVETVDGEAEGLAVRYDEKLDIYVSTWMQWDLGEDGSPVPGSVREELVEYISSDKERAEAPLPVTLGKGSGSSRVRLRPEMFSEPLGPKEV